MKPNRSQPKPSRGRRRPRHTRLDPRLPQWVGLWLLTSAAPLRAADAAATTMIGWMDIEQLSQVRVISVTRTPETIQQTPAAVSVLTGDDLRRSGVTLLPEALRLVPGAEVARINASRYAVSLRGFNSEFADKLLVLMDGRSVYTPQFSGVFWDMQDLVMEDVDRIEVVRGPGGTAWGANAFNGVINVVSKSARDTQGLLVDSSAGTFDRGMTAVRYGGEAGPKTWYRVFAKGSFHGETLAPDGTGLEDDWDSFLAGFRIDSDLSDQNHLMLEGGANYAELLQYSRRQPDRFPALGGHVLSRWNHSFSADSALEVQFYYDAVRREMVQNSVNTDTLDFDARHWFDLVSWNRVQWGVHYRFIDSRPSNTSQHIFEPETQTVHQGGLFLEDQVTFVPDHLRLSVGCKLEYSSVTEAWEPLPNARLSWFPSPSHTLWTSVSRGVRTPSTSDRYLLIDTPFLVLHPNADFETEKAVAYEIGYRATLTDRFGVEVSGFYNDYSDLATNELIANGPPAEFEAGNLGSGCSYGVEAAVTWQAATWWRWRATYSYLNLNLWADSQSTEAATMSSLEGRSPQNQATLWWAFQPLPQLDVDAMVRYVGELESLNPPVGAYWALDLRLAYRPKPWAQIAVLGQNLLDPQHREFSRSPGFPTVAEIPRSVYVRVTCRL